MTSALRSMFYLDRDRDRDRGRDMGRGMVRGRGRGRGIGRGESSEGGYWVVVIQSEDADIARS